MPLTILENKKKGPFLVYVSRNIPEPGPSIIKQNCIAYFHQGEEPPSREELFEKSRQSDGILVLLTEKIDREFFENAGPRLKVVSSMSVGVDHIDINAATAHKIMVTNTPGVLTEATADLTFALVMDAARRVAEGDRYARAGKWRGRWSPTLLLGRDVFGATMGIIGFGRIGQAVARRARGFSMKVLYYDRTDSNKKVAADLRATRVSLDELLSDSDFITVHVPLTHESKNMIGKKEFEQMKRNAVFVNTSRGGIVDQRALRDALSNEKIFAAGLDVFEEEPIPQGDPILNFENLVITPHLGSASVQSRSKMSELAANNLVDALSGRIPKALVNPEVLG